MNYALIKPRDIANGLGVRVSLFVSGCTRHCPDCFNKDAWDFEYGSPFDQNVMNHIIDLMRPDYIRGLSILGGEPFEPRNQHDVLLMSSLTKLLLPNKDIWIYSGYTFEEITLMGMDAALILYVIDILVDGPFEKDKKDITLRFRGSSNQRILNVRESVLSKSPVKWNGRDRRLLCTT